ncbi:NADH dehydrogenase FAD-containing subunit [Alicyclobacillus cycloheptanicus]|uniref:ABC-2 family transporter protein n=1 Tax=Alicyclobacillus cycloheptanicus TaxID=1457 RepID=A0ABT9XI05_9BACL|nr:NADH dehydrogenase FAD-containing subunit [Alicyclobacillus cycloheptanicus]MDQ0189827.1 hypothetical protein [Alicyclobacillus cycloheptanicus]WDM02487.1 NADH dehydrogenase FAD-containing subunit [Alicyclobacillus cycloheptanicus]
MSLDFRKLLRNNVTYISLVSLVLIVVLGAGTGVHSFMSQYDLVRRLFGKYPDSLALISPSQYWVGLSHDFFSSFFHFIYPVLTALPVVDMIYKDKVSGNLHYQLVRMSRYRYFATRFAFCFLTSFALFVLPLLVGIIITNLMAGTWDDSSFSAAYDRLIHGTAVIGDSTFLSAKKQLFSNLMVVSPYAYILVYYFIGGLYAAGYASFGLGASFFLNNRYLVLLMPQCLYIGGWLFFTLLHVPQWDPYNIIDPKQPVTDLSYLAIVVDFGVLMVIAALLYLNGVRRNIDVLS